MATVIATDVTFAGGLPLPKVLVVEANLFLVDELISLTHNIHHYHHLGMVVMHYDPTGKRGKTLAQIVDYARDPENHIAMVLTGNKAGDEFYGAEIAKHLKHLEPVFAGPVALQVTSGADEVDPLLLKYSGAMGVYDGSEPIIKNFAKADGTLERRANPHHPFALLADAYQRQRSGPKSEMYLPKLAVIDADANFCKIINHQALQCQLEYGMRVEALHYDAKGVQGLTGEQIIEYLQAHPSDMVLTGNTYQQAPYGREIADALKHGDTPYPGLVVIQTADMPDEEDKALAFAAGVTHVFNKDEPMLIDNRRNEASSFARIKAEYDLTSH